MKNTWQWNFRQPRKFHLPANRLKAQIMGRLTNSLHRYPFARCMAIARYRIHAIVAAIMAANHVQTSHSTLHTVMLEGQRESFSQHTSESVHFTFTCSSTFVFRLGGIETVSCSHIDTLLVDIGFVPLIDVALSVVAVIVTGVEQVVGTHA